MGGGKLTSSIFSFKSVPLDRRNTELFVKGLLWAWC